MYRTTSARTSRRPAMNDSAGRSTIACSSETAAVDFIAAGALSGVLGLGGDLAGLPNESLARLREHVSFSKQWRKAISRSVAHLLTPPALKTDREGWVAVQLDDQESGTAFLFVYRLNDDSAAKRFVLRELDADATYELNWHVPPTEKSQSAKGAALMSEGIELTLPARYQAAVIVLKREHS